MSHKQRVLILAFYSFEHVLVPITQWRDRPGGPRPNVPYSVYATLDLEVNEQIFRWGGQSDAKLPVLSPSSEEAITTVLDEGVYLLECNDNLVALHFKYDQARRRFVGWAQNEIAVVPDFHKRILFSDEAHFWLNGYVNKQNCRIWSEANPQVYVETPLHPEKLTVWCALWAGGILLQKR
ncbi:hypothetical protein TNCV_1872721 [Trichonephila clavipes]|nr:hypothetical protein TNCV_1872721 [Trichonephila clavipes]